MAAYSVFSSARSEPCGLFALQPHIRVRTGEIFKCSSALRLGLNFRAIKSCGRWMAQAATCERAKDKRFLQNCTLYDFLGLPQDATQKNIKEAYRKSAKIWHPDIAMKSESNDHTQEFLKIRDAYVVLSDPVARERYDEQLKLHSPQRRMTHDKFPGIVSFDHSNGNPCYFSSSWRSNWETDQCW
ncbi:hypothetical protein SUGI_1030440 [Cryptomeria japonica]|uniref:chaperone protein dnaJ 11, chloroplastic n=1 Tax=Cryptomeria japonica TaxID=3369 RepID=UPI002414C402|nr:chaperone protein dnaJ 11, chloroplastic [Cryptomeria japonica]GLJ48861.1 hypothetical protein SUGI_1030440 [Cryptomeria japonica]